MTNEHSDQSILIWAKDGAIYAFPADVVAAHRLSDDQRADMEARLRADGVDVEGFDFRYWDPFHSDGTFGSGTPGGPVPQYDPSRPNLGGWDGVGLRYVQPVYGNALGRRKRP